MPASQAVVYAVSVPSTNRPAVPDAKPVDRRRPLRVQLVGIAGTSRDILLSIFSLKSSLLADPEVAASAVIEVCHYRYVLPADLEEGCRRIAADVLRFAPDLLGFSTYTWNFDAVVGTAARVRKASPDVAVVFGGPEIAPSDVAAGRFDELPVDFLVCGEGEIPLARLVRQLARDERDAVGEIPRLARRSEGRFATSKLGDATDGLVLDLSALPSPYLTGAVPDSLLSASGAQANIETQRGCNFRCAYCMYHANFPSIRYRNADTVLDEIEYVYRRGATDFRITDANFFSRKDYAARILSGLRAREIRMSFFVEVIPSYIDDRIAELMKAYLDDAPGNRILVGVGLQTINVESLRAIRRNLPLEHFDRAFRLLSEAGVIIKTDLILGLPHESQRSYLDLMEYIGEKMRSGFNYLSLALLRVLPGSELERLAASVGLTIDASNSEHFVYETPTMPRPALVECLRVSAVAYRVFHTLDLPSRIALRKRYYEVRDGSGVLHRVLLSGLADYLSRKLEGTASDWNDPDFRRAEHYWTFDVHREVSDDDLLRELDRIEAEGPVS